MDSDLTVRPLREEELPQAWRLGALAFGADPDAPPPPHARTDVDWLSRVGAFDRRGALVGCARVLHDGQWWQGRSVPAADVAGVAVAPEARGRGAVRRMLGALLAEARNRGAAVSTLFPSVAVPYRRAGWEVCGTLREYAVSTALLPRHRPDGGLRLRAGTPADLPATVALYTDVVRHRCGPLDYRAGRFAAAPADALPDGADGLTLVEDDAGLRGYVMWERGRGYGPDAVLTLVALYARDADAARCLVGSVASWQSVTPTVRLAPLPYDAAAPLLPWEAFAAHEAHPWMHRPVDAAAAVAGRGWPSHARGTVVFGLADALCPWNTGTWRLDLRDGTGTLTRTDAEPELRLSPGGFAQLYCGVARAAQLVQAGLLTTGGTDPAPLDLLGCGAPAVVPDYF